MDSTRTNIGYIIGYFFFAIFSNANFIGVEALAKVPQEFVTQKNTNANPPTFFLTFQYILKKYEDQFTERRLAILERLFPRLQVIIMLSMEDDNIYLFI